MKTSWSADYLWQKFGCGQAVHSWAVAKATQFQAKTGVPWTWWTAHGQYKFLPYVDHRQTAEVTDEQSIAAFWSGFDAVAGRFKMATLLQVHEAGGLSLPIVVGVALHLARIGQLSFDVTRSGMAAYIKRR